jgi:hypothetical protein
MKSNSISKHKFFEDILFDSAALALFYRVLCFTDICGLTSGMSKFIYWALILILIPLGAFLTCEKRRNYISKGVSVALPFEIYTVLATYKYIPGVYKIVLTIAVSLSVLYFCLVVFQRITHKRYAKEIVKNRVTHALFGARTIIAVVLLCVTVPISIKCVLGQGLIVSGVDTKVEENDDTWTLKNNAETVALLHEDNWKTLTIKEKCDVLAVCKNIELNFLGVYNQEIHLEVGNLEENVLGHYNFNENTIVIDIDHMENDDSREVLKSLLHECKHAYDHQCVEAYNQLDDDYKKLQLFRNVAIYDEGYKTYIDGEESFEEYYTQQCEASARNYSEVAADEYFEFINGYLANPSSFKKEE